MFFYIVYVCRSTPKNFDVKITASTFKSLKMVLFGDLFGGGSSTPAGGISQPAGRPASDLLPMGKIDPQNSPEILTPKSLFQGSNRSKWCLLVTFFWGGSSTDDLLDFHGCRGSRFSRISEFFV